MTFGLSSFVERNCSGESFGAKKRSGRIGNLRVILPTDVKFDQATKIKLCVAREEIALQTNLVQFV